MQAHTDKQLDTEGVSDNPNQLNPSLQEMPWESTGSDFHGISFVENPGSA